MTISLR
jgi:hypothetical protein